MADQETKPVENGAVAVPSEAPEVPTEAPAAEAVAEPAAAATEDAMDVVEEATDKPAEETPAKEERAGGSENKEVSEKPSTRNPPKNMLRVRRDLGITDDKTKKNRFDPMALGESSDPELIRTQVHFYFGDSNLPSDKFMSELTGGAENKPVPLTTICSFGRMRRFKPYEAVVAALKDSKFLTVEGEEGKETVRRQKPFDPTRNNKTEERSVYVKGFGEEVPSTQFDVEAFFLRFGEIRAVRLRRGEDGGFKGSVFVEWADKETAEKFLALDPQPTWKDHDLLIMSKAEYTEAKNQDIRDGKLNPQASRGRGGNRGNFRGSRRGGNNNNNGADSNDWKKRRENDQKSGFNDRRGGRGGRGGRGRGGHRDGRDSRDGKPEAPKETQTVTPSGEIPAPRINVSGESNGKRAREDDATAAPPAKKVDTKEPAAESA